MAEQLLGLRIAMLVADGFEESELVKPRQALEQAGAKVDLISPNKKTVRSWKDKNWGTDFSIDITLTDAKPDDYVAIVLPGGVINPDKLRTLPEAISFIKTFVTKSKPIAAICHGPWTLINAQAVKDREVTSWPSLEIDLKNAGAKWVDEEVVIDGNIITSRKPEDIPAFNKAIIDLFSTKK